MEKDGGHGSLPKMVEIDGAINENKLIFSPVSIDLKEVFYLD